MELLLRRYQTIRFLSIALFVCIAYGPIAGAVAGSWNEPFMSLLQLVSGRRLELLAHSLVFSLAITVFTTLTGVLAALAILRYQARRLSTLVWVLMATVALPATVPAMGWSYFFALLSSITGTPVMGSWIGAGVAQGMALLPFATGVALLALSGADMLLLDAARALVSPTRLLFFVAIPLARPTLMSGAALVFLLSLLDYTIPSIFGVNTYALEIFVVFSATHRISDALLLSLPLLGAAMVLVFALSGLTRQLSQSPSQDFPRVGSLPWAFRTLLFMGALLCSGALLVPLTALLPALSNPAYLVRTVLASENEAGYTLLTSTVAAVLALLLSVGPALHLLQGGRFVRWVWALCLLPFLVPPALMGVGLIALWAPVRFLDMYGSSWMTVAAELARFTPVSIIVLSSSLLRTDPALFDATIVTGTSLRRMVSQVMLPMLAPGLVGAAGIAFVLSLGDIGANLLVTPAGSATLSMKTYNYLHYGGSQAAAGLCLMLLCLAAAGVAAPAWIGKRMVKNHD